MMTTMTPNQQLELGLNRVSIRPSVRRRTARAARAQWWFAQMRATVANAIDWQTTEEPHNHQVWLGESDRGLKV